MKKYGGWFFAGFFLVSGVMCALILLSFFAALLGVG